MSNGKLPDRCDACGAPLVKGEFRRLKFDVHHAGTPITTQWKTDAFRRYYCPACTLKAKQALLAFEGEMD